MCGGKEETLVVFGCKFYSFTCAGNALHYENTLNL